MGPFEAADVAFIETLKARHEVLRAQLAAAERAQAAFRIAPQAGNALMASDVAGNLRRARAFAAAPRQHERAISVLITTQICGVAGEIRER